MRQTQLHNGFPDNQNRNNNSNNNNKKIIINLSIFSSLCLSLSLSLLTVSFHLCIKHNVIRTCFTLFRSWHAVLRQRKCLVGSFPPRSQPWHTLFHFRILTLCDSFSLFFFWGVLIEFSNLFVERPNVKPNRGACFGMCLTISRPLGDGPMVCSSCFEKVRYIHKVASPVLGQAAVFSLLGCVFHPKRIALFWQNAPLCTPSLQTH